MNQQPTKTTGEAKPHETPVAHDLDHGWAWVVMFASFGSFLIIGGNIYGAGIIHIALLERYGQDVTKTSWVGALLSSMINIGGPLIAVFENRFSCRAALVISGLFYVTGYLATVFAPNIEMCFLTCGVIAGLGSAGYSAATVVIGYNFKEKRNFAMGIAVSGVGVGTFVMAPLFELARDYYGNTGFFFALAGLSANTVVFGTLCIPSKLEKYTKEKRKQDIKLQETKEHSHVLSTIRFYYHIIKQKPVICLCIARVGYSVGIHLIHVHLPNYAVQMGSTTSEASFLISVSGILGVLGRILTGIAANDDGIDDILLFSGTMGITSLATFLFPLFSHSFAGQVIYAVFLGTYFGCCNVVVASINIRFVGVECMATAMGIEVFCASFGSMLGPVLAGVIVDNGGTYGQSFVVAGAFLLLHSIMGIFTVMVYKSDQPTNKFIDKPLGDIDQVQLDQQTNKFNDKPQGDIDQVQLDQQTNKFNDKPQGDIDQVQNADLKQNVFVIETVQKDNQTIFCTRL